MAARWNASLIASTLGLGLLVTVGGTALAPSMASAATTPIACAGNTILVMDSSNIYTLDTSTRVTTLVTAVASTNAIELANTGNDSAQQLILAALLVGVGGAFTLAGRRRWSPASRHSS